MNELSNSKSVKECMVALQTAGATGSNYKKDSLLRCAALGVEIYYGTRVLRMTLKTVVYQTDPKRFLELVQERGCTWVSVSESR